MLMVHILSDQRQSDCIVILTLSCHYCCCCCNHVLWCVTDPVLNATQPVPASFLGGNVTQMASFIQTVNPGVYADAAALTPLSTREEVNSVTAEVMVTSLEALGLRPGDEIFMTVKATDIEAYPS